MNFFHLRIMELRCLMAILCLGFGNMAQADIYKSVDAEGNVTYSSVPSKGAKELRLEPMEPPTALNRPASERTRKPRAASPEDFPKVDSSTQKSRDSTRRRILDDEMASEQKLLAEARANLGQAAAGGNAAKLSALQEDVTLHEKNISALKTELANLK